RAAVGADEAQGAFLEARVVDAAGVGLEPVGGAGLAHHRDLRGDRRLRRLCVAQRLGRDAVEGAPAERLVIQNVAVRRERDAVRVDARRAAVGALPGLAL